MYESIALANAALDARRTSFNSGHLRFYTGARPANVAAGVSGTLLADLLFSATAFGAAAARVITANAITSDDGITDGTIGYAATVASDGTTLLGLHTVSVTGGGGEIQLNSLVVSTGLPVAVTAFTITQPDGA